MWLSNGQLSFVDPAATSIAGFHRVAFFQAPIVPGASESAILAIWECLAYANQTSSCSLLGANGSGGFELKLFIPLQIGNHYGYSTVMLKPALAGPNQLAYPSNSIAFQMPGAGAAATWPATQEPWQQISSLALSRVINNATSSIPFCTSQNLAFDDSPPNSYQIHLSMARGEWIIGGQAQPQTIYLPTFSRKLRLEPTASFFVSPDGKAADLKLEISDAAGDWGNAQDRELHLQQCPDLLLNEDTLSAREPHHQFIYCERIPNRSLQRLWNRHIVPAHHSSVRSIQDGRPLSVLPYWTTGSSSQPLWEVASDFLAVFEVTVPSATPVSASLAIPFRSLQIMSSTERTVRAIATTALLDGLKDHSGKFISRPLRLLSTTNKPKISRERQNLIGITFEIEGQTYTSSSPVRLSAFDFSMGAVTTGKFNVQVAAAQPDPTLPRRFAVHSDLTLGIASSVMQPGAQDPVPDSFYLDAFEDAVTSVLSEESEIRSAFERPAALVIPITDASRLSLNVQFEERAARGVSSSLTIRVTRQGNNLPITFDFLYLGFEPQLFGRAITEIDDNRGAGTEVANWSSTFPEGPQWRVRMNDREMTFILPAAVLGEAAEKGLDPRIVDIKSDEVVDARFGSPTRFRLSTSEQRQRFSTSPTGIPYVFGFPGLRSPGAIVRNIRHELLYGLVTTITQQGLRIAETSALLGAPPRRQPRLLADRWTISNDDLQKEHEIQRLAWARTYHQITRRLAVLELWRPGESTQLLIEKQLAFEIRPQAKLRFAVREGQNNQIANYIVDQADPSRPAPVNAADLSSYLAGGYGWGFEFLSELRGFLRNQPSTGGALARLHYSSRGGSGFQRAEFRNGLTKIYSDTNVGRVNYYSVEQIGRIGVLFNKAKRVIVFERTVARALQFESTQEAHEGRAILRKVREYVEILEPIRKYPEFGAVPATRGFVEASEFISKLINVDSNWGEDMGNGFCIPLWRPGLSDVVYPKPKIVLRVTADTRIAPQGLPLDLAEPQNLYFYADTVTTNSDTDLWPSVSGVDFTPLPRPLRETSESLFDHQPDATLPNAASHAKGYERFTFAVAPAEHRANLVAERQPDSSNAATGSTELAPQIGAVLRNVTMTRAQVADLKKVNFPFEKALSLEGDLAGPFAKITARLKSIDTTVPNWGQTLVATAQQEILGLGNAIEPLLPTPASIEAEIKQPLDNLKSSIDTGIAATKNAISTSISNVLANVSHIDVDTRARALAALKSTFQPLYQLLNEVRRAEAEFTKHLRALDEATSIQSWHRAIQTPLSNIDLTLSTASAWTAALKQRVNEDILQPINSAVAELDRIESVLLQAQQGPISNFLGEFRTKITSLKRTLLTGATAVQAEMDAGAATPTTVRAALATLRTAVTNEFNTFTAKRSEAFNRIGGFVFSATDEYKSLQSKIRVLESQCELAIQSLPSVAEVTQAVTTIANAFNPDVAPFKAKLDAQINQVAAQIAGDAQAFLTTTFGTVWANAVGGLAGTPEQAQALVNNLVNEIQTWAGRASKLAIDQAARGIPPEIASKASNTLALVRAFGDAPVLPNLAWNRNALAYYFDPQEILRTIDITPSAALLNRAGESLKGLGMRLPSKLLGDGLIPDKLENLDFSTVFPDFAGIQFDKMFPGFRLPSWANDRIKLAHGVNPQTRRNWAEAKLDFEFGKPVTLFNFGPVAMRITAGRIDALARIEGNADGTEVKQDAQSTLTGNWELNVGGLDLLTFRDTPLRYRQAEGVRFDLKPENVQLQGALQFVADLMKRVPQVPGSKKPGLTLRLLEKNGVPTGAESILDLPVPNLQFGAFGIAGMRLFARFALELDPADLRNFSITVDLALARPEKPFALNIWILAGAGCVTASARYTPRNGLINTNVLIRLAAGAMLAFDFGGVAGASVAIFVGIELSFSQSSRGDGAGLSLGVFVQVIGSVNVIGLFTASLNLILQANYQSQTGEMVCRGTAEFEFRMSWLVTIRVRSEASYNLTTGSKSSASEQQISTAADEYCRLAA